MDRLLQIIFSSYMRTGTLQITTAAGRTFTLGDGTGQRLAVRFTSTAAQRGFLLDPELKLGEAYMDGTFIVEEGSIAEVLDLAFSQGQSVRKIAMVDEASMARTISLAAPSTIQPKETGPEECRASL